MTRAPLRIVEVLATLKRAGAESMVAGLVSGLDRSRFAPFVVSLYDPFENGLEGILAERNVPVIHLGKRSGFDPRMFTRLRKVLRNVRPDIVHTHSYVMRYTLPVTRCGMVHTVHNLADREVDAAGRLVHRLGFRMGVVPVAVAGEVARSFKRVYGFEPATIPNGIEVSRYRAHELRDRREVVIVSVARLEPQKNPGALVRALPANCRLQLAGDGSLRRELEGLDRVEVMGVRPDIPEVLRNADIFALASDWEGHPLAVMEAMAAGLPVVATAVGGIPEIVGDAGMLVPPGDVGMLRSALESLAGNPARRAELGNRARRRAASFDVSRMVEAYSELFERLVRK